MTEYKLAPKSYGETKEADKTGLCRCRPTNVLYWELSEADSSDCPLHGCPSCILGSDCPSCGGSGQWGALQPVPAMEIVGGDPEWHMASIPLAWVESVQADMRGCE